MATGSENTHLLVAVTADRGLAGAFNSNIGRAVRLKARKLEAEGKKVKILAVGRKGNDYFKRELAGQIAGNFSFVGRKTVDFVDADAIADKIVQMFRAGEFDVATLVFNSFVSVMTQRVTEQPLIPAAPPVANDNAKRPPPRNTRSSPMTARCWTACCRATSRCRSIPRCWKMPPASTPAR